MDTQGRGFTLIELIVTVAIVAVLIGLVTPSMKSLIETNRIATRASQLMLALQTLRSEAVKRNRTVRMCKSDNGSTCNAIGWASGWLIWFDSESDNSSEVLQFFPPVSSSVVISNTRNLNWVGYRNDGTVIGSGGLANSTWNLCSGNNSELAGRAVVISRVGRPRYKYNVDCGVD